MAHAPIRFSTLILGPHLEISDLTREALREEGYLSWEGAGPSSLCLLGVLSHNCGVADVR